MTGKTVWVTTTWLGAMNDPMALLRPLADRGGLEIRLDARGRDLTEEEVLGGLRGVAVVMPSNDPYNERIFSSPAAGDLRMIARTGVGLNSIDLAAATARGVLVTNAATQNTDSVAEHAVGLMLAAARRLISLDRKVREGRWNDIRTMSAPLKGRTIGILGLGNIGKRVARVAAAFGMEILAFDIVRDERFAAEVGVYYRPIEEVASRSDFLTCHIPLTEGTKGILNRDFFSRVKPGAFFVHTSRGPVVNFDDLAEALAEGRLGGAGIDVYPEEPPETAHPLFSMENVVFTPHVAGLSEEACEESLKHAVHCVLEFLEGRRPPSVVNPEVFERPKRSAEG